MSRLRLTVAAALWAALGASVAPRAAAQSIPVTIGGDASSLVGVPFDVPIQADLSARTEKLGSFALTLRWNPAVLGLIGGGDATFGTLTVNTDSVAQGVVRLTGANPAGVGGVVTLTMVRFAPLVASVDTLRLQLSELYAAGTFADLLPSAVVSDRPYCAARGRWGDIDADGAVNSRDALIALSAAVGLPVGAFDVSVGDVDGDGATGARDALIVLSNAVGLPTTGFRLLSVAPGACSALPVTSLSLDPGDEQLTPGDGVQYRAIAHDGANAGQAAVDVFWRSSSPGVASVTPNGTVIGVAPGTAVISAIRSGRDSASATVTVTAQRHTYWVDALAFSARNQIGSSQLPFASINKALDRAQRGDTVRVRSGRYDEGVYVYRPVVLMGDTTAGGSRPLLTASGYDAAIDIGTDGRVELTDLRVDTVYTPIWVEYGDTVFLRHVDVRAPADGYSAIEVDQVNAFRMSHVTLTGMGSEYYYSVVGLYFSNPVHSVVIDSSFIGDFGDDGVFVPQVDSLVVRGSTVQNNYGAGIDLCGGYYYCGGIGESPARAGASASVASAAASAASPQTALFSRNRFVQNDNGHVLVYGMHRVQFDHNTFSGSGYDGTYIQGDSATVVTFLGDSVTSSNGSWIDVETADSVIVDSVSVHVSGGTNYFYYVPHVVVRSSRLSNDGYGTLLYFYANSGTPGTAVLQNLTLRGACGGCSDGVYSEGLFVDADSVTLQHLYNGIEMYDGALNLRRARVSDVSTAAYTECGSLHVDSLVGVQMSDGFSGYGCDVTDSATIARSSIMGDGDGFDLSSFGFASLTSDTVQSFYNGAYVDADTVTVTGIRVIDIQETGIQVSGNGQTSGATVAGNLVQCAPGNTYGVAIDVRYGGGASINGNTVNSCPYAIQLQLNQGGSPVGLTGDVTGNYITMPAGGGGYQGIYVAGSQALVRVLSDTVTGIASDASIWVEGGMPLAQVDSNVITNWKSTGIRSDDVDSLYVRWNTIAAGVPTGSSAGIHLYPAQITAGIAVLRANRVTGADIGMLIERGDFNGSDSVTAQVDSNAIKHAGIGVLVRNYGHANLHRNGIDSSATDAVQINQFGGVPPVVADSNNFTNSVHFGMRNFGSIVANAINNYWGDAQGPRCDTNCAGGLTLGDSASTNVTYHPFLTTPAADAAVPAPPRIMAVTASALRATPVSAAPAALARGPGHVVRDETALPRMWQRRPVAVPESGTLRAAAAAADRTRAQRDAARSAAEQARKPQRTPRPAPAHGKRGAQ